MKLRRFGAVLVAASMVVAACGGDDDDTGAATGGDDTASETGGDETATGDDTATATGDDTATATGDDTATATGDDTSGGGDTGEATAGPGCGLGNGEKATGDPIYVGHVTTSVPGIDFSTGPTMMEAYFNCVNDNGGINGRPIMMKWENDNLKPEDAAAAARKLIETEKVVAVVGGFSIIDCPVNADYYEQMGYNVLVAGVPAECFSSPAIAAVNMGPGYSALGAAQAVVAKGAQGKIVTMTNETATSDYNNSLAGLYAQQNGLEWEDIQIPPPIEDATSAVIDAVNRAGEGGAIILNYTPPEGLKILKAAEEQGLIDKVIWGSSTPLNDTSVAQALGAAWAGKLNVNAEFSLLDDPRPEVELYRKVSDQYNPEAPYGSFQQMGFLLGRIIVHTMLNMDPADLDDPVKVNAAIKEIKNFRSDHLCKPWYFGGLPDGNVPNNTDYNVVPDGTKMVDDGGCFEIAEVEPILTAARKAEKELGLNTGG